jgi:hypothetical protein
VANQRGGVAQPELLLQVAPVHVDRFGAEM